MIEIFNDTNVWVALSFIIFVLFTFKTAKSAILKTLDNRIEAIKKEIETVESLRVEAQELLAQYQRKRRDAAKEAQFIVDNAKEHAKAIQREAEAELKVIMKRREKQLEESLSAMKDRAIKEIQEHATDLAFQATREIIQKNMTEAVNNNLVQKTIEVSPKILR